MTKCAINRFKAGGNCAGSGSSGSSGSSNKAPQNIGLAAMIAARESQDRKWASPALQKMVGVIKAEQQLVVVGVPAMSKQKDMNLILQGDLLDN